MAKPNDEHKHNILHYALHNAITHKGKAEVKAVLGKILSEFPHLKKDIEKIKEEVEKIVNEVNKFSHKVRLSKLKELAPHLLEKKKKVKQEFSLPPLEDVKDRVVTAFPPEPSGYPHLGHAKSALINYMYAKQYEGKFVLRFEDTNPELAQKEFYDAQLEGLRWLNISYDELFYISDTIDEIYKKAEELIKEGYLYACKCSKKIVQENRRISLECECKKNPESENLKSWNAMLNKKYKKGKIIIRLKGDMDNANAVMRDPTMFRIINNEHPRHNRKYIVWPSYDFAAAYSDGVENITHRVRSKEFELRAPLQSKLQELMGFNKTTIIEQGRFNLEGVESSKRVIRDLIKKKKLSGWDDPRLSTLIALKRRGFDIDGIKNFLLNTGLTKVEALYKWDALYSENRKIIDKKANRYFFVEKPKKIKIQNAPKLTAKIPMHPDFPERGNREIMTSSEFYIQDKLDKGENYRFIHLFNFVDNDFISVDSDEKLNAKLIHWLPAKADLVKVWVVMPDGSVKKGLAEESIKSLNVDDIIQFQRFGFCRLDKKGSKFTFYYTHN